MGRLASRVGMAKAKQMSFTARYFSAREACEMGLIGAVVPDDQLDAAVEEVIREVRLTGPNARRLAKLSFNRQLPELDYGMYQATLGSPECIEAFKAFVEKRDPSWSDG